MASVDLVISVAGLILTSLQLVEARLALADERAFREKILLRMDTAEKLLRLKQERKEMGDDAGAGEVDALVQQYANPILEGYLKSEAFFANFREKYSQEYK